MLVSRPRIAGVTLPLFSLRSERDWGIGEIADLPACARLLRRHGFSVVQLLPPHELALGETSPYGARTGFGLDPIYASVGSIVDLGDGELERALGEEGLRERDALRALAHVDYGRVRALKMRALEAAFRNFEEREWKKDTARTARLRGFVGREEMWEQDLALYVALREEHGGTGWSTWPTPERTRDPATLDEARARLAPRIRFHQYLQWQLFEQWESARAAVREEGVMLYGDLPFVVGRESSDVWSCSRLFRSDLDLGAPPDEFSDVGQSWGLPPYDWNALEAEQHAWLRARAAHAARLYHGFRLDHVVGYFRQYVRKGEALGDFDPKDERDQESHGRRVLTAMRGAAQNAEIIVEDLGVIPQFVRRTLGDMSLPGYKIIPWEKEPDETMRNPAEFPEISVASYSTHDTPPLLAFYDSLPARDRASLVALAKTSEDAPEPERERALLSLLFSSRSALTMVLVTEIFGERTRINTPSSVGAHNWSYRIPAAVERLEADARLGARLHLFGAMLRDSGRAPAHPT
ncbi:MAG TPA: 4-alpha-glucanotransferase [Polyangiaceae bacterium]|jgi:4-alpha-glucanotransferase